VDYITLGDALHEMASRLGLPDSVVKEQRTYTNRVLPLEYWEQHYLYAWKYSYAAASLHQCLANSNAQIRWLRPHPATGFAVIDDGAADEGMSALTSRGCFVNQEQEAALAHAITSTSFDQEGRPHVQPRTVDTSKYRHGFALAFDLQSIGLVRQDLDGLREIRDMTGASVDSENTTRPITGPDHRAVLRLQRLRELGGDYEDIGPIGRTKGRHGALADLIREESAKGHPMSDKTNIRQDLLRAIRLEKSGEINALLLAATGEHPGS
jgi:hypothetical protein